ncbi:MAG: hypothetical protein F4Z38_01030 [Chloroflexi bacterium]|nr:hypothetical protein [Chloroflexota bacterium]MYD55251.1 hypothetical protein [Chloroflexota bacterium]
MLHVLEDWAALFHEGGSAFFVIGGGEAGLDEGVDFVEVSVVGVFGDFLDDPDGFGAFWAMVAARVGVVDGFTVLAETGERIFLTHREL